MAIRRYLADGRVEVLSEPVAVTAEPDLADLTKAFISFAQNPVPLSKTDAEALVKPK